MIEQDTIHLHLRACVYTAIYTFTGYVK